MLCINLESDDPCFNLALEEYYFRTVTEDVFITGINSPSVIIGKHQIANEEANVRFLTEHNVPVIRRMSGGGTVYHDHGNVNFTFITQGEAGFQIDFGRHTRPVTDFLESLGIDARLEGRSDIRTGGLKVSGNAGHVFKNRTLHHGTLLFDSSLKNLHDSLLQSEGRYISRAVASNRTSVTNIAGMVPAIRSAIHLKSELYDFVMSRAETAVAFRPGRADVKAIAELAAGKYRTWEWNYAYGPAYRFVNRFVFRSGMHACDLDVREGLIVSARLEGSELSLTAASALRGVRHNYREMRERLTPLVQGDADMLIYSLL